ncbi:MAG TPA: TIGR01459 family HAD-type hydrolase [Caulobacteraceae bacterium]|jgi:HAD superfamily hydrolase (TIGR01459 family)|nr:TIGR01459 family HAD-type hydrolase [Caulobacteraceae bacterium]
MSAPRLIAGLAEVASAYDAVLCDVWGVIHNGRESFPEACEALVRFNREHGPVVLLSNAPRPAHAVKAQLRGVGVPDAAWADFVTSGDATRVELAARAPGPVWAVGPARDAPLYEGVGVEFTETPEAAAFVACTGPFDDEKDEPEDYRDRFEVCVGRGLTMICANPDLLVRRGDKMIYCGGALAQLYATMGGAVVMAGKPHAAVYRCALEAVDRAAGRAIDPARVLAIGDGLATDVKGANAQGLDCLFVGAGIDAAETLGRDGLIDPVRLEALLIREGATAKYAMADLRW